MTLRADFDPGLSRGLLFMTLHFPDQTPTNVLTIEATDPIAGTAEFKASAVAIEAAVGEARPRHRRLERLATDGGT